ncbi:DUF3482 domain-containing protein [Aquisalimonas sp.]|uniref:GTPase/DUF3482 domain-containing protein n=1 Tax=Aquisalimonas sp. TaxID=1872621 RepID=UPI0025C00E52|nr:DUF3482 domain-containing protein [Aquisalimonas sp.]
MATTDMQDRNADPGAGTGHDLHLVVAGHTNVGKTSLLRTLGRTATYGEVSSSPSTTQQVQPLPLIDTPDIRVTCYDTPGLENSTELVETLENARRNRHDNATVLLSMLDSAAMRSRYEQELRVLDQILASDACIYVIDAREPVLEKYLDELLILASCGRPLLPLLNFTACQASRETQWREALRRQGHQVIVGFDAVVYRWDAEHRLYKSLGLILPSSERALEALIASRAREADWRLEAATMALATALIDCAACQDTAPVDSIERRNAAERRMRHFVHWREQQLMDDILKAFNYAPELLGDRVHDDIQAWQWQSDPFSESTLRYYGVKSMGPVASGALAGSALDASTGGTLLGAGTVAGGLLGAGIAGRKMLRSTFSRYAYGIEVLKVSEAVIRLIALRNLQLIATLQLRGHASMNAVNTTNAHAVAPFGRTLPKELMRARDSPDWSTYHAGQHHGLEPASQGHPEQTPGDGGSLSVSVGFPSSTSDAREKALKSLRNRLFQAVPAPDS